MELRRPAQTRALTGGSRALERCALAALAIAAFAQAPGELAVDTKLDIVVAPVRFVTRAAQLWDRFGGLGQIPNQTAGYLWPMGAFFSLGDVSPVPMWLVQRAWLALVLCAAALGVIRLAAALGLGGRAVVVAGVAYALSANVGGLAGAYSGTVLPTAVAPWALLPFVRLTHTLSRTDTDGSSSDGERRWRGPRTAAARGAVALACAGGINATATLAAAVLPAAWIVTQLHGRARRVTALWWVTITTGATAWWWGPLLLQGKFGVAFDKYTEGAAVTTATSSVTEAVRGTHYWLGRLTDLRGTPWIPATDLLGSWAPAAIALAVIAAAGWYGIARGDLPRRSLWCVSALLGTVVLAAGYAGAGGWRIADVVHTALDGPAAPLRNIYKFDVLVRLPLAMGIAGLGPLISRRIGHTATWQRSLVTALVATLLALNAAPFLSGKALPDGRFSRVSSAWDEAADWLHDNSGTDELALVVPAASFGEFVWGRTLDDPLQPLATSRWATRDIIPLGADAGVAFLDAVQEVLERGEPDPGLAAFLARSGVRYLVARYDLDPTRSAGPRPAEVHDTLSGSGLTVTKSFGEPRARAVDPYRVREPLVERHLPDIEVFVVPHGVTAAAQSSTAPTLMVGDAATLLDAARLGVAPAQMTIDAAANTEDLSTNGVLVSDRPTRRAIDGTAARANTSYPLEADQSPAGDTGNVEQRSTTTDPRLQALPVYTATAPGAAPISATFDATSYGSVFGRLPERQPYAAFDGDPLTAWEAATPGRETVEVHLDSPIDLDAVDLTPLIDSPSRALATLVEVTTEQGATVAAITRSATPQRVLIHPGSTSFVRITHLQVGESSLGNGPGWAEIDVAGVKFRRSVVSAQSPALSGPVTAVASRDRGATYVSRRADVERTLDRTFPQVPAGVPDVVIRARRDTAPQTSPSSAEAELAVVRASSVRPSVAPAAVAARLTDGNTTTGWVADPTDPAPYLDITTDNAAVDSLTVVLPNLGDISRTEKIVVLAGDQRRELDVDSATRETGGRLTFNFPALRAARTRLVFLPPASSDRQTGLALGATELTLRAGSDTLELATAEQRAAAHQPDATTEAVCGDGPTLEIGATLVEFASAPRNTVPPVGSSADPQRFVPCSTVPRNSAGALRVLATQGNGWLVDDIALLWDGGLDRGGPESLAISPGAHDWSATPGWDSVIVSTNSNFSTGWHATSSGARVRGVRIDGWRQGFTIDGLPSSSASTAENTTAENTTARITAHFEPQRLMALALFLGAIGLLLAVGLSLAPGRPSDTQRLNSPPRPARCGPPAAVALTAVLLAIGHPVAVAVFLALTPWRRRNRARSPQTVAQRYAPWSAGALVLAALVLEYGRSVDPSRTNVALAAAPHLLTWAALGWLAAVALAASPLSESEHVRARTDAAPSSASAAHSD